MTTFEYEITSEDFFLTGQHKAARFTSSPKPASVSRQSIRRRDDAILLPG